MHSYKMMPLRMRMLHASDLASGKISPTPSSTSFTCHSNFSKPHTERTCEPYTLCVD